MLEKFKENMNMSKITVSNIEIEIVRKNIKNIHLSVHAPDGRVRMSVPLRFSNKEAYSFAESKINWIKKHREKFKNKEIEAEKEYISGETHYYEGKPYILNVIYTDHSSKVSIRDEKYIDLYVKEGSTKEKREKVLSEWYRKKLKQEIPHFIDKWEPVMGVKVNTFGVKNMKTRWGTCNIRDKRIWLNLRLAEKQLYCLEYVVVHEMVHLLERNHNKVFIGYMDKFLPNWREIKDELNGKFNNN